MNADVTNVAEQEPIGIVISGGPRPDHAPTFFAYVWADDPDGPEETGASRAA